MTSVIRSLVNAYSRYIHVKQEQHDWRPLKVNAGKSKAMVHLTGWVGDKMKEDITGAFGVQSESTLEEELYMINIYLSHRYIHKNIREPGGRYGMVVMIRTELLLVK